MISRHMTEYRDPEVSKGLIHGIRRHSLRPVRLMEVCGTHTMSIFRNGIRSLLPDTVSLLSGPGCPVCVTTQNDIDAIVSLSRKRGVIMTTFGDLIRVPGTASSLKDEQARGADIRIVYSPLDALEIAENNPGKKVVFPGVGFETTAPAVAASILLAEQKGLENFFVYSAHKLVPPALAALAENRNVGIDGFILPGHVSVMIGTKRYLSLVTDHRLPCAVAGFEPVDILMAVYSLVRQLKNNLPELENTYQRAVTEDGNTKAMTVMNQVFEVIDVAWRGIGMIPASGLKIRKKYISFDAQAQLGVTPTHSKEPDGCACGKILLGIETPFDCPLYGTHCTPMSPVGPCMVSSEGACAAYYRYQGGRDKSNRSKTAPADIP